MARETARTTTKATRNERIKTKSRGEEEEEEKAKDADFHTNPMWKLRRKQSQSWRENLMKFP